MRPTYFNQYTRLGLWATPDPPAVRWLEAAAHPTFCMAEFGRFGKLDWAIACV